MIHGGNPEFLTDGIFDHHALKALKVLHLRVPVTVKERLPLIVLLYDVVSTSLEFIPLLRIIAFSIFDDPFLDMIVKNTSPQVGINRHVGAGNHHSDPIGTFDVTEPDGCKGRCRIHFDEKLIVKYLYRVDTIVNNGPVFIPPIP